MCERSQCVETEGRSESMRIVHRLHMYIHTHTYGDAPAGKLRNTPKRRPRACGHQCPSYPPPASGRDDSHYHLASVNTSLGSELGLVFEARIGFSKQIYVWKAFSSASSSTLFEENSSIHLADEAVSTATHQCGYEQPFEVASLQPARHITMEALAFGLLRSLQMANSACV